MWFISLLQYKPNHQSLLASLCEAAPIIISCAGILFCAHQVSLESWKILQPAGSGKVTHFTTMAVICICGICVPYTIFWPLVLVALKPVWEFIANLFGWEVKNNKPAPGAAILSTELPIGLFDLESDDQWTAATNTDTITFVRFTSSWCVPCKKMIPLWTELSQQHKELRFISVDVDKYEDIAAANGVVALPMFFGFKDGKEVGRLWGTEAKNEDAVRAFVNKTV